MMVKPAVAKYLEEAHYMCNLPININIGLKKEGLTPMTIEYEEEDELLVEWMTTALIDRITREEVTCSNEK